MANPQHLAIARQGKGAWNDWQAGAGMGVRVDFTGANFIELEKAARDSDPDFLGYDFSRFVFSGDADFIDAVFSGLPTDRSLDPGKAAEGGVPLKGGANFDRAVFGGNARFQRAVFGGDARFRHAVFGGNAGFRGAVFGGYANFDGAVFGVNAGFRGAVFGVNAGFRGAVFGGGARFEGAVFGGDARFRGAVFGGDARFQRAVFGGDAWFRHAVFGGNAGFQRAVFGGDAWFWHAVFGGNAGFEAGEGAAEGLENRRARAKTAAASLPEEAGSINLDRINSALDRAEKAYAVFGGDARFEAGEADAKALGEKREAAMKAAGRLPQGVQEGYRTRILGALDRGAEAPERLQRTSFAGRRFAHRASFADRHFSANADFSRVRFDQPPNFGGVERPDFLDWAMVEFSFGSRIHVWRWFFGRWTWKTRIATNLRRLRKIAADIHANDAERDLFVLERQAERGIQWAAAWRAFKRIPRRSFDSIRDAVVRGFRAAAATIVLYLYIWLSNCGRSALLPLAWGVGAFFGFRELYAQHLAHTALCYVEQIRESALSTFTLASSLPFVGLSRIAFSDAIDILFDGKIPQTAFGLTVLHGIVTTVLLFLFALALRNHFKVK